MKRLMLVVVLGLLSYGALAGTSPPQADIATGKALCVEGEGLLEAEDYAEALVIARKVLALLPASPRGKAIYDKAIRGASRPTLEVLQILMSVENLFSVEETYVKQLHHLSRYATQTAKVTTFKAKAIVNELSSLSDRLEEIEETTIIDTETQKI